MDQIKLRNSATGQECDFDDVDAARNFMDNIADSADWHQVAEDGTELPVAPAQAAAPAALGAEIPTLTEVHQADEAPAATETPAEAPAVTTEQA